MFDFQKHRNFNKSYRFIIRILVYGLITAALLFLIQYQQQKINHKQTEPYPEMQEIPLEDSLYIMEEPLESIL
jgi:hypothetical protein